PLGYHTARGIQSLFAVNWAYVTKGTYAGGNGKRLHSHRTAGMWGYSLTKSLVVFQGTCRFCERFLEKRDRTVDQMVQAARSGRQNIVEASKMFGTPKENEIKLLNVSRFRFEE